MNRQQKFELTWIGSRPTQADDEIAKNYLSVEELDTLIRIVSIYLGFAELQVQTFPPGSQRGAEACRAPEAREEERRPPVEPHGQEPVAPAVRRNPPKLQSSFAKASEDTRIPPRPGGHGFLRRRVKYPAYPKYTPSGIEWLGEVPEHWQVKRLKYISEVCN